MTRDDIRESSGEGGATPTNGPVTVRVTESGSDGLPAVSALHETDATVEFPSFAAASAFADRLTAASDDHEFLLTPDHRTDATFFLRCQDAEALD